MGPAGAVLRDRLRDLVGQVRAADQAVRDEDPDGVHDLRVAMRRTRSLLPTFRPLLDHQHRAEAGARARRQTEDLLGSDRHAAMLRDLDAMAGRLSWQSVTESDVRGLLRREWRRVRRRAAAAEHSPAGEDHEPAMHDVRKAAKRTRYAAESLTPLLGEPAARMARVAERIQESLGTHRDTLLSRGLLDRLAGELTEGPEVAATIARLRAREEASGARALEDYARARASSTTRGTAAGSADPGPLADSVDWAAGPPRPAPSAAGRG